MEVHTVHNNFVFDYRKPNDIQICEFFIKTICENIKRRWMSDNGGNIGSRICIYNSIESINVREGETKGFVRRVVYDDRWT